jgi:hypothetical protein
LSLGPLTRKSFLGDLGVSPPGTPLRTPSRAASRGCQLLPREERRPTLPPHIAPHPDAHPCLIIFFHPSSSFYFAHHFCFGLLRAFSLDGWRRVRPVRSSRRARAPLLRCARHFRLDIHPAGARPAGKAVEPGGRRLTPRCFSVLGLGIGRPRADQSLVSTPGPRRSTHSRARYRALAVFALLQLTPSVAPDAPGGLLPHIPSVPKRPYSR